MMSDLKATDFDTKEVITWCPGCTNFGILAAAKKAFAELVNEKAVEKRDLTIVTGVGCHAKIYDYIDTNGFYSLHGRTVPAAVGINIGNPKLKVVGFTGDGDSLAEGVSHFIYACRHNADITVVLHENQVFALTTGQATPTSEPGYKGKTTPHGNYENPINPLALALTAGATFVARTYSMDIEKTKEIMKEGIKHKGIAIIEVMQPCITFYNNTEFVKKAMYWVEGNNKKDFNEAYKIATEWNYTQGDDQKLAMGIFYQVEQPTFTEKIGIK